MICYMICITDAKVAKVPMTHTANERLGTNFPQKIQGKMGTPQQGR